MTGLGGGPAREELIKHHAQGVDVGPGIQVVRRAGDLLRAHVRDGPDELPRVGVHRGALQAGPGEAGDPEVEDLRLCAPVERCGAGRGRGLAFDDQDVPRLEVAVNDPPLVRVLDRIADPHEQVQPRPDVEPALLAVTCKRQAGDELHREIGPLLPVELRVARVVDLRDPGVPQASEHIHLLLEATQQGPRERTGADDLHRDGTVGKRLRRLVHAPHPALAQQAQDAVRADTLGQGRAIAARRGSDGRAQG